MEERTLWRGLSARPPMDPVYRPGLDPTTAGARARTRAATFEPRRSTHAPVAPLLGVACGLAVVLGIGLAVGSRTSLQSPIPSQASARPPQGQHQVIPAELGGRLVGLSFDVPPTVDATSNQYMLNLGWPNGPFFELWWRVGGVNGDPCSGPVDDPTRRRPDPSPSETYELIRNAPVFDVSPEVPFAFAGATGRAVDITLDPDARRRCAAATADRGGESIVLTGAGKGYEAAHLTFPLSGAMRLAVVEVGGHELLIAITGSSISELDRWEATLGTFQAEISPVPLKSSPEALLGRFDVGGRSLYLSCLGSGGPTVVLDGGAGNDTHTWDRVVSEIAKVGRVCAYDRANVGRSDSAPVPRTLGDTVSDLHALLSSAAIAPPYVLVGHSFGGLDARLYAATYPNEVAGIVLVDASPAEFIDADKACARLSAAACREVRSLSSNAEMLIPSAADMATIGADVPSVPARILAATNHGDASATGVEIEKLAGMLQAELAASWPRAGFVVAQGSGHYIQDERPDLVVEAVTSVVQAARLRGP